MASLPLGPPQHHHNPPPDHLHHNHHHNALDQAQPPPAAVKLATAAAPHSMDTDKVFRLFLYSVCLVLAFWFFCFFCFCFGEPNPSFHPFSELDLAQWLHFFEGVECIWGDLRVLLGSMGVFTSKLEAWAEISRKERVVPSVIFKKISCVVLGCFLLMLPFYGIFVYP